jgi:hypothetical protein
MVNVELGTHAGGLGRSVCRTGQRMAGCDRWHSRIGWSLRAKRPPRPVGEVAAPLDGASRQNVSARRVRAAKSEAQADRRIKGVEISRCLRHAFGRPHPTRASAWCAFSLDARRPLPPGEVALRLCTPAESSGARANPNSSFIIQHSAFLHNLSTIPAHPACCKEEHFVEQHEMDGDPGRRAAGSGRRVLRV